MTTSSDRRRYGAVALLMAGILLIAVAVTAFTRVTGQEDGRLKLVAASYPVYIAALNITEYVEGIRLSNLVPAQTGCLHDYQLSPDNMITLSGADALILNGAGAESFLDTALERTPSLVTIDSSEGVALLESGHVHDHDHGDSHEEDDHDNHGDHDGHEEDGTAHAFYNEHIWVSPDRYIRQVENIRDGLAAIDPGHAGQYRTNAAAYITQIETVRQELLDAAASLPAAACITFHDSMTYLAEDLGLHPVAALSMGEEGGVSAADIREAEQASAAAGAVLLLYDGQYPVEYAYVADRASLHRILTLDTAAGGENRKDAWLDAMRKNAAALRSAA